jgi:methyl-accepting chemotaxis protein
MKNLKISLKLIISFMIVLALMLVVGGAGIIGLVQINKSLSAMYDDQTKPMPYMAKIQEMIQRERACMREFIIGAAVGDMNLVEDARKRQQGYNAVAEEHFPLYRASIRSDKALNIFDDAIKRYRDSFNECTDKIYQGAKNGADAEELYDLMRLYTDDINIIVEDFEYCLEMKVDTAKDANESSNSLFLILLTVIIAVIAAA